MSTTPVKFTIEEYLTYDDGTDKRYELEDGVLVEMPPGTGKHEAIITLLLFQFLLEKQRLGFVPSNKPNCSAGIVALVDKKFSYRSQSSFHLSSYQLSK